MTGENGVLMAVPSTDIRRPLCVDLDGTLLATDALWESLIILLKTRPLTFLILPIWILKGKAFFKRQVAQRVVLNPSSLPFREDVLAFLRKEKSSGTEIILASASDQRVAEGIAHHLGIFSAVLGSDGRVNLSGRMKLQALEKYAGSKGFDYMGNAPDDLPLWKAAHRAILVHPSPRLLKRTRRSSSVHGILSPQMNRLSSFLKALRVHQWVKNALLFVPLLMAHKMTEIDLVLQAVYAFIAFSLCASSVYIVNDLLDLEADRQHPHKRFRPFAAGMLQIKTGVLLAPLLLGCAFAIAFLFVTPLFSASLALYLGLSTAYTFYLKKVLIVDVLLLAGLYTLRVLSGAFAVSVTISPWLLAFSMFLFLSLAILKRYSELRITQEHNQTHAWGRSYAVGDIELLRSIGPTSGYLSVLVLALYINSKEVIPLYHYPAALWLIGPCLLYWLTRMWLLAHRGEMADDPLVFSVKDPQSYVVGILVATIIVFASL